MDKNICLVFPRFRYKSGEPPLGIAYLVAVIQQKFGFKIDVLDSTFIGDKIFDILRKRRYDYVGLSFMTSMLNDAKRVISAVRNINPNSIIFAGGAHPTVATEHTLRHLDVDFVILGEGEQTISDLIESDFSFHDVPGIAYIKNDEVVRTKPQRPISDLDSLPFPDFSIFDIESYIRYWFPLDSVSFGLRGTNIMATRGCPYQCSFCQPTLDTLFGKKVRMRSPSNVLEEMLLLSEKYRMNAFQFEDDTLIVDEDWIYEFSDILQDTNKKFIWGCNIRADLVTPDLLKSMYNAGLHKVFIGIESGSQRILDDIFQKGITLEQVKRAVVTAKDIGLKVQGYFILGAPTETKSEMDATINFAASLPIDEATFSVCTPLPATYLYEQIKTHITHEFSEFDYYRTPVFQMPGGLKPSTIDFYKKKAFLKFYLHPNRILDTVKAIIDPRALPKTIQKLKRF